MPLDNYTILAAGCAVLVLLGLVFVFLWSRDRTSIWLLFWGAPYILGGLALIAYMRHGWESDYLSISAGNAMRILAIGSLWQGVRLFHRRRLMLWPVAVVVFGWAGLCLIPQFTSTMAWRIEALSLANAVACGLAALELWRDRADRLQSRGPLIVVFASFATLMLLRAALANAAPLPVGARPMDTVWLAATMLIVFLHAIFAAILFLGMTMERRVAEQRNFAMSDPLTGLLNRRAFSDFAERMNRRSTGMRNATSLLVLDLDHFKLVNDRFGHEVGDRMLQAFAQVAETSVRPTDQLFRMGGEEFCFVLPDTTQTEAIAVAERIRRSFEAVTIAAGDKRASATVSIGIAGTSLSIDLSLLLAAADAAVYEAKARGRNRVVVAEPSAILRPAVHPEPHPIRLLA